MIRESRGHPGFFLCETKGCLLNNLEYKRIGDSSERFISMQDGVPHCILCEQPLTESFVLAYGSVKMIEIYSTTRSLTWDVSLRLWLKTDCYGSMDNPENLREARLIAETLHGRLHANVRR